MPVTIQIHNVPDELHRNLKSRGALAGTSLSAYVLNEISKSAERPTVEEMRAWLATASPVNLSISPAEMIRAARGTLSEDQDQLQA
jgi:plasmid stability protein